MTTKDETYQKLRDQIITNQLTPGHRINEKAFMQTYGIGRTPLREILLQLRDEGLVEIVPQVGTQVAAVDIQEIRSVIEVRRWLEMLVGRLAAERITTAELDELKQIVAQVRELQTKGEAPLDRLNELDVRFHTLLYQTTGNKVLVDMLPRLLSKMDRFWYYIGLQAPKYFTHFDDLQQLVEALEHRDRTRAQEILGSYLDRLVQQVKSSIL